MEILFHSVSEHTIGGGYFDAEVQLVHKSLITGKNSLILSIFLQSSAHSSNNVLLDQLWAAAGYSATSIDATVTANTVAINPYTSLLPAWSDQFYYIGSRTTPNCDIDVIWFVFEQPVPISSVDLGFIRASAQSQNTRLSSLGNNNRPIQPVNGRAVVRVPGRAIPTASPSVAPTVFPTSPPVITTSAIIKPNKLTQKALIVGSVALGTTGILYFIVFAVIIMLMMQYAKERRSHAASIRNTNDITSQSTRVLVPANNDEETALP